MSRLPRDRFLRMLAADTVLDRIRTHAERLGLDPDQWPWPPSLEGIEARQAWQDEAETHGVQWSLLSIDRLAAEAELGAMGPGSHRPAGGPPPGVGGGLQREDIIKGALWLRERFGEWPTQKLTATMGLNPQRSIERVKQVQGPRGWKGILEDAQARSDEEATASRYR